MSEENIEKQGRDISASEEQSDGDNLRREEESGQQQGPDASEPAGQQDPDASGTEGRANSNAVSDDTDQLVLDQQQRIAELEQKVEELTEISLRRTAELDNARKRMQRERIQLMETSKAQAIEYFLPVYDDLYRTIDALDEQSGGDNMSGIEDGIRLVADKFRNVLERYDVKRIDQTGVPFDVDLHDALMRRKPEDESTESNVVLQVLESGYRMGDRTIRHAKVIVSE